MDDIEKVFNGRFKEQRNSESAWTPVPDEMVPKPRWVMKAYHNPLDNNISNYFYNNYKYLTLDYKLLE